jgi:hypothetical protein
MAFTSTLSLVDAGGVAHAFDLVQNTSDGTRRLDAASPRAYPRYLNIKHTKAGSNGGPVDRHLIQLTEKVATTNGSVDCVVNLSLAVPQAAEVTDAKIKDMLAHIFDFLIDGTLPSPVASTNTEKVLRGES